MHEHERPDDHDVPTVDEHAARVRTMILEALGDHHTGHHSTHHPGTRHGGAPHRGVAFRTERIPVESALGRTTAERVDSPVDLPLFRNSQMDGFAVRAADLAGGPIVLPVVGVIAATASTPPPLAPGTAVRIMTGAVVPEGADAVVPIEATSVASRGESGGTSAGTERVSFTEPVASGTFVRPRGSDLAAGDELLPARRLLAARHLAALSAAGITEVTVLARPRIAVITTGSELVDAGAEPRPGEVHDANAVALVAAATSLGAEVVFRERVRDDETEFAAILATAIGEADIVITSGGISHGDFEIVRDELEPLGAWVGHVAMQPGGPQALIVIDSTPVLCFPGNPVSTQLSFEVFVAPVLRELAGMPAARRERRELSAGIRSPQGKRQFLRGRLGPDATIAPVSGPGSHLVAALAASDALVDVPADVTELDAGTDVEVWIL